MVDETNRRLDAVRLGPGAVVAVLLDDRVALAAAVVALFSSRRVLVVLDPALPPAALASVVSHLQPDALLIESALRPLAAELQCAANAARIVAVDTPALALLGTDAALKGARPDLPVNAAYICYTSGSTGEPKGVIGRLDALSQFIRWEVETLQVAPGWRVSQLTPPGFDPLFRDLFVPLCTGGTCCAPPAPARELSADALVAWLAEEKINVVHCVPTLARALTTAGSRHRSLPDLRFVLLAGEMLRSSLLKQWHQRFGAGPRFVNLYGATETTMVKLFHFVTDNDRQRPIVPIGKPIDRAEVLVQDPQGKACAPGSIGEIVIRSPDLTLGYYRNPAATAACFAPWPAGDDGFAAYRTGDLGRELEDGSIDLIGRTDAQVKIRGVRVELPAIQAILESYPRVRAAEVVCLHDDERGNRLIAYVELNDHEPLMLSDVRVFMRSQLPNEMVPATVIPIAKMPLTLSGKVDRRALPPPEGCDVSDARVAPRSQTERLLAAIWTELLGLDSVGVNQDFLAVGGHSIVAAQMANRVRDATGREVSLATVFTHPTIAELAAFVDRAGSNAAHLVGDAAGKVVASNLAPPASNDAEQDAVRYRCPTKGSKHFGARRCRLVVVVNEQMGCESFERSAAEVRAWDPSIETMVVDDAPDVLSRSTALPTLTFAPAAIRHRKHLRGAILCGSALSKSEEYAALERGGIPVPPWGLMTRERAIDLSRFGPYVVTKPNHGAKGAAVRLRRRDRVRWKPVFTAAAGMSPEVIVQEYIYTGRRPRSFRVTTLFGHVLYAVTIENAGANTPSPTPSELQEGRRPPGVTIVSNAPDARLEFCNDPAVIELAQSAHRCFPAIPLLGIDILRDADTKALYVIEVNAIGYNWNFPGSGARSWDFPLERQFDGLRKAAWLLADQTQRLAC